MNVTVKQQPESITLSGLSGNIRVGGGVTLKADCAAEHDK